jgi:transposase
LATRNSAKKIDAAVFLFLLEGGGVAMTCTKEQIRKLMNYVKTSSRPVAAAKAGMSLSTAKRYIRNGGKPKQKLEPPQRDWKTRADPFVEVWPELVQMLEKDVGLEAKTLMYWLMERYPEKFNAGQLRTLQRRVRDWRVLEGPDRREVFFPQEILPGRQSQSDYTHCNALEVTIDGEAFPHMLFHFMLPFSRWEYVCLSFTESFDTLTSGYTAAIEELGAVASEHRTDNLAAAVPIGERNQFQRRWKDFLRHYGVEPSANNPGKSNENGSVEKSHDLFKRALDQRLRLRGSRNFGSVDAYEAFLRDMSWERNRHRREKLCEELRLLKALPKRMWDEPKEFSVGVSAWSTIVVANAIYSVPSRFIGLKLKVLMYYQTLKVFYGSKLVQEMPRQPAGGKCINYRHLILHLMRKPGAFRNYMFREELFPRLIFRQAYDALRQANDDKADKEYLKLLNLAAMENEQDVASALDLFLQAGKVPDEHSVRELCSKPIAIPEVNITAPQLNSYDTLLTFSYLKGTSA